MSKAGIKASSPNGWTAEKKHALGQWFAPIVAWAALICMLLAVIAVLLGPAD